MKVINIPRYAAEDFERAIEKFYIPFEPQKAIWISICEPDVLSSVVSNELLDQIPKLILSFWDVTQPIDLGGGEMAFPPSEAVAKAIVDFILSHRGKSVIVNCAAGISRSGAVAQFCADFLGYEWNELGKRCAIPNHVLYTLMRDYFMSLDYEEQHGPKPLLTAYEKHS